jgi:hypothetical protein
VSSQAHLNKWCVSSTNGHIKPWELKPQQKDLMQVLRRPVETTPRKPTFACVALSDATGQEQNSVPASRTVLTTNFPFSDGWRSDGWVWISKLIDLGRLQSGSVPALRVKERNGGNAMASTYHSPTDSPTGWYRELDAGERRTSSIAPIPRPPSSPRTRICEQQFR